MRDYMSTLVNRNDVTLIKERARITQLASAITKGIEDGEFEAVEAITNHFFVPDIKSGLNIYARELKLPKGAVAVGKIHKGRTLNIISQGRFATIIDGETVEIDAPHIWVSEPGVQKAAHILEDVTWVNIHITEHNSEEGLPLIEKEVIAETFEELGLIDNIVALDDKGV